MTGTNLAFCAFSLYWHSSIILQTTDMQKLFNALFEATGKGNSTTFSPLKLCISNLQGISHQHCQEPNNVRIQDATNKKSKTE
jgi:hypothetical protein